MKNQPHRILIIDSDADTLIELQHVFEESGIDTEVTWDEREACTFLGTRRFDLVVIGDHPPEVDAAVILQDFSYRGTCPPVLVMRGTVNGKTHEQFRRLGAIGVVPKRDASIVVEQATKALAPMVLKAAVANASARNDRALRAAS
jgi:DNA-binding NtrC family response regulator